MNTHVRGIGGSMYTKTVVVWGGGGDMMEGCVQ